MRHPFRRRPQAEEIISTSLHRRDYKTAAIFVVAGCLEVLDETEAERQPLTQGDKVARLRSALAPEATLN